MSDRKKRRTILDFARMKRDKVRICTLTAYDYISATLVDAAGVDGILVGDSLANVVQGRESTLPVTLDEIIYHAEMVGRAVEHAMVIVDLPFPTTVLGPRTAVEAAAEVLKRAPVQAVKVEGGRRRAETLAAVVDAGIPVMGHCGLTPQSIHGLGGHRVQRDRERLLDDVKAVEDAGAFCVVLECIPHELAAEATELLSIPTIGIGAGAGCDGQILVFHDLVGLTPGHVPKHVKAYANCAKVISDAVSGYCDDVRSGVFPSSEQSFD
jgi:3-methyl-2-oxobutanoate hydroxymethyltransferase